MPHAANIYRLGIKELWSLVRDPIMLVLIAYTFTVSIYVAATAVPETLHRTPICIVDEDRSPLSGRIAAAFYPPRFHPPAMIPLADIDSGMDTGDLHLCAEYPAGLSARRAGRQVAGDPAQRGRHSHESGIQRQQLYPADRARRGQRLQTALPEQCRAACRSGVA